MKLYLNAVQEAKPGPKWQALFEAAWPSYEKWFLSEGITARPGFVTSRRQLRAFMPELLPVYEQLVELAGGGDVPARFLSLYCPPPYLSGCSQAVWPQTPLLVRNYDYSPRLFEGNLLYTKWLRPVIAMSDSLWGVLDGINEAGLAVSLAFGGRKMAGKGFGIPLILRYILELCDTADEAGAVLQRVPVHMPYNVTVLDRAGQVLTAYLGPDRPAEITTTPVSTNHQNGIDWADYARLTSTVKRRRLLEEKLADPAETEARFIQRFRQPPLYNTQYEKAFGTLYTAVYRPEPTTAEYLLPNRKTVRQSFTAFKAQRIFVALDLARTLSKSKRKKFL
ncbi:MAG: C45 family peptidase [Anaerolineae bacterium]|nr:C45 family peptidase [Anaerolineae bacterium]